VLAVLASGRAEASSHREAPAISNDPAADNTDVYAWVTPGTHDKLYVIANWIPLEEPSGGPNFHKFADDALYEVHLTRGDSLDDVVTYQFLFHTAPVKRVHPADLSLGPGGGKEFFIQLTGALNQTYDVTRITYGGGGRRKDSQVLAKDVPVAPPRIGPRTQAVANSLGLPPYTAAAVYDDSFAATFIRPLGKDGASGRVFAGPRDDAFYVDLGGIFDLANLRPKGVAQDGVAGFNTHAIALEIPTKELTVNGQAPGNTPSDDTTIGVWSSTSRRKVSILRRDGSTRAEGPWVQVSRLGLPLINEAVIGYQDKDYYNRTKPKDDVANFGAYFLNPVIVRDAEAVGIYAALGVDPTPFKSNRTDILDVINLKDIPTPGAHSIPLSGTGDVLRLDMATDSAFPNGRPIVPGSNREQGDVTDVLLSLLLTKLQATISDGVDNNDATFLTEFPFLALPWQGFDQGHGKPTP
jgi:hypothetical protein